jgi:P27 family predicted phage terminase small subunit
MIVRKPSMTSVCICILRRQPMVQLDLLFLIVLTNTSGDRCALRNAFAIYGGHSEYFPLEKIAERPCSFSLLIVHFFLSHASLAVVGIGSAASRPHPAEFDPPSPPPHLGKTERQIWEGVFRDYSLSADVASAVLATALEAHQRARECREAIATEGMTVAGRDGQTKVHPLLAVERDARAQWFAGVKALGLEL